MAAIDMLVTSGNGPVECRIALMALVGILEKEAVRLGCTFEASDIKIFSDNKACLFTPVNPFCFKQVCSGVYH